jgi:putative ABC transport system permease protein
VNLFQLILKNMRQRSLSSVLTILSVLLGTALAIGVIIAHRESDKLFVQSDFGYNLIIGPKGDELRLTLNSVYGMGKPQGLMPWTVYTDLLNNQGQNVRWAIPFAVGDTWKGKRIIATPSRIVSSPQLEEFRKTLTEAGQSLAKLAPPAAGTVVESAEVKSARIASVPGVIDAATKQLTVQWDKRAGLDGEIMRRFRLLRESLQRAEKLMATGATTAPAGAPTDAAAMSDAAGAIVADVGRGLMMLSSFSAPLEVRQNTPLKLDAGRPFHPEKFEGIIGSNVAEKLNMKLDDIFKLEHGGKEDDVHDEKWKVVGILQRTNTAMDDALFIPLISAWCIPEHSDAMEQMAKLNLTPEERAEIRKMLREQGKREEEEESERSAEAPKKDPHEGHDHEGHDHDHAHGAYHLHGDRIHLELPEEEWKISGIFTTARAGNSVGQLQFAINNQPAAMVVSPAYQMSQFFEMFMKGPSTVLLWLAILVTVVAAISILVSIYNSIAARRREIAILRALGATRAKVLTIICLEAALIGAIGAVLGLITGHVIAGIGSQYMAKYFGSPIDFVGVSTGEWLYVLGVVALAAVAGLVPALKAYETTVAENLVAE